MIETYMVGIRLPIPVLVLLISIALGVVFRRNRRFIKLILVSGLFFAGLGLLSEFSSPYFSINPFTQLLSVFAITVSIFIIFHVRGEWEYLLLYGVVGYSSVIAMLTVNFFLFFVLLELILIASIFLIFKEGCLRSIEVAEKYFLTNVVASVSILMGISLNYGYFGSLNPVSSAPIFVLSLMAVGLLVKTAVFPFYSWLPDVSSVSSTVSSALICGLSVNLGLVGFFKFLRFSEIKYVVVSLVVISVVYMGWCGLKEWNLKSLLGYSVVVHLCYILISIFSLDSVSPGLLHLLSHGLTIALLILITGVFIVHTGEEDIRKMQGIGRSYLGLFFLVGLVVISFVPALSLLNALDLHIVLVMAGAYWVLLGFYVRIFYFMFVKNGGFDEIKMSPTVRKMPIGLLSLLVAFLGVFLGFFMV